LLIYSAIVIYITYSNIDGLVGNWKKLSHPRCL
jgi:hypothetical protein